MAEHTGYLMLSRKARLCICRFVCHCYKYEKKQRKEITEYYHFMKKSLRGYNLAIIAIILLYKGKLYYC